MRSNISMRFALGAIVAVWTVMLGLPTSSQAQDPVEKLRQALKSSPGTSKVERSKKVQAAMTELKTLSQLRRAFFLTEWSPYVDPKFGDKAIRAEMGGYRKKIGEDLRDSIVEASKQDGSHLTAVAMLIGEIAESNSATEVREVKGTFLRGFTDVLAPMTKSNDLQVRQAALSALGKITPDPAVAIDILQNNLKSGALGPQRLAAYALVDLVKKSKYHPDGEQLPLLKNIVDTAALGLKVAGEQEPGADEATRGYCLEGIQEAAIAVAAKFSEMEIEFAGAEARKKVTKEQAAVLDAFKSANPVLAQALADTKTKVRLEAMAALDQISVARAKIMKSFEGPDPLEGIIERNWQAVARLLKEESAGNAREEYVRLRRGAIAFFEQIGEQAAPAEAEITDAMRDEDRFVRLTAMRAIRNLPPAKISGKAIAALAFNLLTELDSDLNAGAADALEAIGPAGRDAVAALALVVVNAGDPGRHWDVEIREKAMKALASIGGPAAHKALPELLAALKDSDVRMRRGAAETIGQFGRPADDDLTKRLIDALSQSLRDGDAEVRLNASEAILTLTTRRKL
jgi:HEAT repeat protein